MLNQHFSDGRKPMEYLEKEKTNDNYYYSKIIEAKDGNLIPLCTNRNTGQEVSLHSKYNPLREAEGFTANIDSACSFFVILGIGGAYHIQKLLDFIPDSKIIAIERNENDIAFLLQLPLVKKLSEDERIVFATLDNIEQILLKTYKPAVHGNLTLLKLRQWETLFPDQAELIRQKINSSIKLLAQDYSVQSHFGKIWQKNILSNLSLAEKALSPKDLKQYIAEKKLAGKTAAVIAAGPGLEKQIEVLKKQREKYFIIATDTAFSTLLKHKLISDAVISIDGQEVSHTHFMTSLPEDVLYVFDLCASSSAARKIISEARSLLFIETGHPLSQYASLYTGRPSFLHLEAGSGTVTIAAASLAKAMGIQNIEFFGADFSYIGGKPYVRGTYLEDKYYSTSSRLSTAEEAYTHLMYRTPVIKVENDRITTEILEAYKKSLQEYMNRKAGNDSDSIFFPDSAFNLRDFKDYYCKDLKNTFENHIKINEDSYAFTTLLPLCAKLGKDSSFIAYLRTLRYTETI